MAYTNCNNSNSTESHRRPVNLANPPRLWQCCNCSQGWFSMTTDPACPGCLVRRCGRCIYASS
ncbi:hypothetical protein CEP53_009685 [Fusarium sp. AF-6]|nr:hypothetical protein CEP53_009685 [Fusarium sp. AF-6]